MSKLATLLQQKRALFQLLLALIQVSGAVAGLYFLCCTGLSTWTILAVCITGLFTVLSLTIKKRNYEPERPESRSGKES